jgi:hypothetical protein
MTEEDKYNQIRKYQEGMIAHQFAREKNIPAAKKSLDSLISKLDGDGQRVLGSFYGTNEEDITSASEKMAQIYGEDKGKLNVGDLTNYHSSVLNDLGEEYAQNAENLFGKINMTYKDLQEKVMRASTIAKNPAGFSEDEQKEAFKVMKNQDYQAVLQISETLDVLESKKYKLEQESDEEKLKFILDQYK